MGDSSTPASMIGRYAFNGTVTTGDRLFTPSITLNGVDLDTRLNDLVDDIEDGTIVAAHATNADNVMITLMGDTPKMYGGDYYIPFVNDSSTAGEFETAQECSVVNALLYTPSVEMLTVPNLITNGSLSVNNGNSIYLEDVQISPGATKYPSNYQINYTINNTTTYNEKRSFTTAVDSLNVNLVHENPINPGVYNIYEYNFINNTYTDENNTTPTLILPSPDATLYGREIKLIKYSSDGMPGTNNLILSIPSGQFFVTNNLFSNTYVLDSSMWYDVTFTCVLSPEQQLPAELGGPSVPNYIWLQTSYH